MPVNITEDFVRQLMAQVDFLTKQNNTLTATVVSMNQTINELDQTINELNQTIKELKEQLNKNSKNSSKPPSSDGLGSSFAALFGVLPNTSFSQNVGLVAMNKVVNRFCIATGGIFLIACGLFPKLAALISIMPQSVLGGAAVMMFSSIVVSGIQLITKWPIGPRNVTIVSVALGLGYGLGSNTAILVHLPQAISLIFGGSGIVPAAVFAIILNIVLPKDEKSEIERAEEMLEKVKNK